ncbi:MAG: hypothetical protein KF760_05000 [Candidatus Eremiobacteraeota bacterium]|nr:hypothetical protein [Candidatus Eremiobacteraeota bacterium]
MDIRRILRIVRERSGLFLAIVVSTLLIVVVLPQASVVPIYRSTARILLTPPSESGSGYSGGSRSWYTDRATLQELVTSERLLTRVVQSSKVRRDWVELKEKVHLDPLSADYQVTLFSLGVDDASPEEAKQLTDALVKEFVSYVEELSAREFANTRRFLEELVAEAREKVDVTEDKLLKLTTSHASADQSESLASDQNELELERRKLKEEAISAETEVNSLGAFLSGQSDVPPWAIIEQGDNSLKQLETAASDAKLKLMELEELYTDKNIQVVAQREKVRKVQSEYKDRLVKYVQSLRTEKAQMLADRRSQLKSLEARLADLRSKQLSSSEKREVAKLQRQLTMWEDNYLQLVKQLYQARVGEQSSKRQGAITVLQAPMLGMPVQAEKRQGFLRALAFGLPFSIAVGLCVLVGLDYLRSSMRILPQIESRLDLPVLTVIPQVPISIAELWEGCKRDIVSAPRFTERSSGDEGGAASGVAV